MKSLALLLPSLLWVAMAQAAAPADTPVCNPEGTQTELNLCAFEEFQAADAELNATWRKVLARMADDPLAIAKLKAAQRLWIQFRDADLEARFPLAPDENPRAKYGSIHPMELANAKTGLTRDRTRYLQTHWLEDSSR